MPAERFPMRKRLICIFAALVLVASTLLAPFAWAEEMQPAEGEMTISADNLSAVIGGCAFGINDFERASAGSNAKIGGAYHGYVYLIGEKTSDLMVIATRGATVVYIDAEAAQSAGYEVSSEADQEQLKSYVVALDEANASGGLKISTSAPWYFTTDSSIDIDGVRYTFAESIDGKRYNCVIGTDGSDITGSSKPTHALFASLVKAEDTAILAQPGLFERFSSFLSNLDWSPLWVTLKTTLTAIVFVFILGLLAGYFCLRISPRKRDIFDAIFTIPMVLPPTVCGFLLLLALGNNTGLGRWFIDIGFPLIFSWPATVIAATVVAFPLMYRSARGAFEALDPNMLDAARTLGWSESRIFFKLMLPLAWSSIAAGTVLAFARALGEFGATLFLAGNYLGITRTIPIAIYFEWMNGNTDIAIFWTIIILIVSFLVILFINLWGRRTTKYRQVEVDDA